MEAARQRILANSARSGVSFVVGEAAALFGLWAGASLILQGRLTSGAVISFVLYGLLVARGLRRASDFWGEALRGLGATRWIFELLAREPRMPVEGGVRLERVEGAVTLDGVGFRYPTRPDVEALTGVDLHVGPGEVVALVGRSGAGKSTILNLLLRFYDADEGRVSIDGHDTRTLDASWLRSQIGVVLQEPVLFSGTIADNIRYGLTGRTDAEVAAAAEVASAREFIERFPAGFATQIGTRGVQLSGGQRQRLAIARAVLRRPRILILDEATNALDSQSEAFVHQALRALDYGRDDVHRRPSAVDGAQHRPRARARAGSDRRERSARRTGEDLAGLSPARRNAARRLMTAPRAKAARRGLGVRSRGSADSGRSLDARLLARDRGRARLARAGRPPARYSSSSMASSSTLALLMPRARRGRAGRVDSSATGIPCSS